MSMSISSSSTGAKNPEKWDPILKIMQNDLGLFSGNLNHIARTILSYVCRSRVIGIMGVTHELGPLRESMFWSTSDVQKAKRTYYCGNLCGYDVVVMSSTAGKVAATSAVVDLITNHEVDLIVLSGTAAAADRCLNIGDVTISERVIQYDADFSPLHPIYQIPGKEKAVSTSAKWNEIAVKAVQKTLTKEFLNQTTICEAGIKNPAILRILSATADRYAIPTATLQELEETSGAKCIDMEGVAIAQTARDYGVPFISIRAISNYVQVVSTNEFETAEACTTAADDGAKTEYSSFLQIQRIYSDKILQNLFLGIAEIAEFITTNRHVDDFPIMDGVKIGIICTLEADAKSLTELFNRTLATSVRGKRNYYCCQKDHVYAVVVGSGIGKTAAAATATELIESDNVDVLLDIGKATSLNSKNKPGEVVMSDYGMQFDVNVRPFRKMFQVGGLAKAEFPAHLAVRNHFKAAAPKGSIVPIASGDRFIQNTKEFESLRKLLPDRVCIDFNAGSVAQIADQYEKPFAAIKLIVNAPKDILENNITQLHETIMKLLPLIGSTFSK